MPLAKTILHIAEASGGVERYLVTLLTKLKKNTEYKHVLVCSSTFDTAKFKDIASEVVVVQSMQNAISARKDLNAIIAVRKTIRKLKPDIVYCHSSKAGAIGRMADLFIKNSVIYNPHGWAFNMKSVGKKKIKFYELVERMLALLTDKIVCISEYEKKSALEHQICKTYKLEVINNGIDFNELTGLSFRTRSDLGIPQDAFVVGTVGRLTPQKAPDVFVKAAAKIKESVPNAHFLMVGDDIGRGDHRRITEALISEYGLTDFFQITGWVEDPMSYTDVLDVAVLLSRWEGFGLVLPEYMYMEKPIVATKADAIPYVVSDAGILVDIDDYDGAAEAVIRLHNDRKLRLDIIKKGKERVKLFDAQITSDEHEKLFRELC